MQFETAQDTIIIYQRNVKTFPNFTEVLFNKIGKSSRSLENSQNSLNALIKACRFTQGFTYLVTHLNIRMRTITLSKKLQVKASTKISDYIIR